MKILKYRFAIHSKNPEKLKNFYTKVLKFRETVAVNRKDEMGFGIEATKGYKLWIAKHSKITGSNKDKFRILLSFYVDDIYSYFKEIEKFNKQLIVESPTVYCKDIPGETRLVRFLTPMVIAYK